MKNILKLIILGLAFVMCFSQVVYASEDTIQPENWIYVDGLGRTDTSYSKVAEKTDHQRVVGMFYHTWHNDFSKNRVPVNLTEVIKEYPEAAENVKENHKFWVKHFEAKFEPGYFWNEPIFGYYKTEDEFVLRKHAELLADAGVDFIFFDCTNGRYMWEDAVDALIKVWYEAMEDGVDVPKLVFWLNLAGRAADRAAQIQIMYNNWYSNEEYSDLWFNWEGKPLVLTFTDIFTQEYENKQEIEEMFTFRAVQPSYFNEGGESYDYWGWLSVYPQCKYGYPTEDGRPEQMAVGVAQNADSNYYTLSYMAAGPQIMGRSYACEVEADGLFTEYSYSFSYGGETFTANKRDDFALLAGRNFQQQWDFAIECDPDVVMVTAWNEWTAYRNSGFCDAFTDEYSRDIEPTTGVLKDHYYYQLVANVRRYKGLKEEASAIDSKKTIDIYSDNLSAWDSAISYKHYSKSTRDRSTVGYKSCFYENQTMRNDIIMSKVAYDDDNLYFYVATVEDLSPDSDPGWMRLFIDTDYSGISDNWEGFEYVINRVNPSNGTCILEKSLGVDEQGAWKWQQVDGTVNYSVNGNILQLSVPRRMLEQDVDVMDFGFKWSDNMQTDGDIMDFYSYGDVAPGGRFCFHFHTKSTSKMLWIYITIIAAAVVIISGGVMGYMLARKKKKSVSN